MNFMNSAGFPVIRCGHNEFHRYGVTAVDSARIMLNFIAQVIPLLVARVEIQFVHVIVVFIFDGESNRTFNGIANVLEGNIYRQDTFIGVVEQIGKFHICGDHTALEVLLPLIDVSVGNHLAAG